MNSLGPTLRFILGHPLNRGGRWRALARFARWQMVCRLAPDAVALPFVDATSLVARRGMTGATGNWYCGLHELGEMAFVLHLLRPDDVFVDVGANIGSYTVLASGAAGATTVAVEPVPGTFRHLQRNVSFNALGDRVRCLCVGLSERPGTLRFTTGLDTVNHVLRENESTAGTALPVDTLDAIVGERVPTLVKIDVEGHERAVLSGADRTLRDPRLLAVLMEINGSGAGYGVSDDALVSHMRDHGFTPHAYDPFARKLMAWSAQGDNAIFVRDGEAVGRRLAAARRFSLVNGSI